MTDNSIPISGGDIKDLAQLMIDTHGQDAEAEAAQRASNCRDIGDVAACEAWWRVEAAIREIRRSTPSGKPN